MKNWIVLPLTLALVANLYAQSRKIPVDTSIITQHNTMIKGKSVSYTAETGTHPVWDKDGEPIATLFYTYYTRNGIKDISKRPLLISFNGGPGSASVWMHIAYTGPMILRIDDEGYPIQPYGIRNNPYSILDVADILFVNPVNTGYSRIIQSGDGEVDRKQFFGINADIKYLAEWINSFVSRHNRWLSPKYLIGESYGGTRVAGLAGELQSKHWMYLNGVILVSPADYKVFNSDPAIRYALNLPYFAATAWHHGVLDETLQTQALEDMLPEVERYAIDVLMPALAKGGNLPIKEKEKIAKQMAAYIGLDPKTILQHNLQLPTSFFWKELLRNKTGYTIGRLDSRYLGLDKTESGSRPDYNAELSSWLHAFTPAINYYIRTHLKFVTDVKYNMFGNVHPWDRQNNNTRERLRQAMAQNPYLHVLFQAGYYDGATTYFNSKYTLWQVDPSGKMKNRMSFKAYKSGHMMYLRREDLKQANEDLREFILKTLTDGTPAKY